MINNHMLYEENCTRWHIYMHGHRLDTEWDFAAVQTCMMRASIRCFSKASS